MAMRGGGGGGGRGGAQAMPKRDRYFCLVRFGQVTHYTY